ncbi:Ig-like domain-containing protein [Kibdelosporangium persicum]|uniref:Lipoprotein-anchoring transpeptidase ErfK/SrfK n=1 Tax=Kibdelosporangium persicum TaxID=2698649 RepID=A0ABX2FBF6_9PSEU|nr:Ig-like domain-containing protein [Kibdelosporangium persicum]NRN68706.1 Lipoprotein-anchoring transpeptidase ErfK/SrfK [Kibdelosporangium persicum]
MTNRRGFKLIASLAIAATLGLTACSGDDGAKAPNAGTSTDTGVAPAAAPTVPTVTTQPANGAADANPGGTIQAAVENGTINEIRLSNPEGKEVKGTLAADKKTWSVGEHLGYGKTYTWSGTAVGGNGQQVPITGSFTTVKPKRTEHGTLNVGDNKTYGIAMPIKLDFKNPVADKASVEKALKVETSVPTEGAWAWLGDSEVHWRPKEYWKPDTKVTVTAKLYGTSFGNGVYGKNDVSSTFSIGRDQRVEANTQTHRLIVRQNGNVVHDFPASYGLESDKGRVTPSGIHVVMEKHNTYSMSNPRYNYENVVVPWAVRFSNHGEFIHGYAPSIPDQGKRNVSHGCANLSPANAKIYFDSAMVGDPIEVTGSSVPMSDTQFDYFDWAVSWDKWLEKSALT